MIGTSTFRHDQVFPIIAHLIAQCAKDKDGAYVGHDAIVSAVLADSGASPTWRYFAQIATARSIGPTRWLASSSFGAKSSTS